MNNEIIAMNEDEARWVVKFCRLIMVSLNNGEGSWITDSSGKAQRGVRPSFRP